MSGKHDYFLHGYFSSFSVDKNHLEILVNPKSLALPFRFWFSWSGWVWQFAFLMSFQWCSWGWSADLASNSTITYLPFEFSSQTLLSPFSEVFPPILQGLSSSNPFLIEAAVIPLAFSLQQMLTPSSLSKQLWDKDLHDKHFSSLCEAHAKL